METIYEELMIKRWRLERPNLLISVTGIADDINGIDGGLMGMEWNAYENSNFISSSKFELLFGIIVTIKFVVWTSNYKLNFKLQI